MIDIKVIGGCQREEGACKQGSIDGKGVDLAPAIQLDDASIQEDEASMMQLVEETTGLPLMQSLLQRAQDETWPCATCGAQCRIILDAHGYGTLLDDNMDAPEEAGDGHAGDDAGLEFGDPFAEDPLSDDSAEEDLFDDAPLDDSPEDPLGDDIFGGDDGEDDLFADDDDLFADDDDPFGDDDPLFNESDDDLFS